mmetsp:Transcript_25919/g.83958  ORF Transcript_25919/g.83958 Transcript_25919/m.83958 type:complete len:253 (-) Transcript_25919:1348-2106(-)
MTFIHSQCVCSACLPVKDFVVVVVVNEKNHPKTQVRDGREGRQGVSNDGPGPEERRRRPVRRGEGNHPRREALGGAAGVWHREDGRREGPPRTRRQVPVDADLPSAAGRRGRRRGVHGRRQEEAAVGQGPASGLRHDLPPLGEEYLARPRRLRPPLGLHAPRPDPRRSLRPPPHRALPEHLQEAPPRHVRQRQLRPVERYHRPPPRRRTAPQEAGQSGPRRPRRQGPIRSRTDCWPPDLLPWASLTSCSLVV